MNSSRHDGQKRCMDALAAAVALLVTAPLQVCVAVAVRIDLGAPVLFRQPRPGLHGRPFTLCKFRTMRNGGGSDQDRLTPVGRWLRSTSLDELPTLWNVLRGDMSLVGPRPLLMTYLSMYSVEQSRRHEVRPGITGLAQVTGRNELDWEERFALDVLYVDRRSLSLDLGLLIRTIGVVLRRRGIAQRDHATMTPFEGADRDLRSA